MAIYVGARVRSVTIEPDWDDGPERYADILVEWPLGQFTDQELCEKSVLVALAGPVAAWSSVVFRFCAADGSLQRRPADEWCCCRNSLGVMPNSRRNTSLMRFVMPNPDSLAIR